MISDRLEAARAELRATSKAQIDTTTAETWGARAVAAHELFTETKSLGWLQCAIEYAHEAIEHAASGLPGTLDRIRSELKEHTGGALP
jgi:hypothetical protein